MKSRFIDNEIIYTGKQLAPSWIYKNYWMQGDAIVAFTGECDLKIEDMVDIEDYLNNTPIYSKNMLSFIIEHYNIGLVEGVVRQRLFMCIVSEVIKSYLPKDHSIMRKGDDLFYNGGKLSVSICTRSISSVLMHIGVNIDASGAPVKAAGLTSEMGLTNIKQIAEDIMNKYIIECESIIGASTKVRGVY
ncbi:MAG: DUF366 family protein [Candidatus Gastranaerophilales bacterium]|nr:DUF366 family protein [Candidatus Gastranaerophilales bacterium]